MHEVTPKHVWSLRSIIAGLSIATIPVLTIVLLQSALETGFESRTASYVARLGEFYDCQAKTSQPCIAQLPGATATESAEAQIETILSKFGPVREWRIVGATVVGVTGSATLIAEVRRDGVQHFEVLRIESLNVTSFNTYELSQVHIADNVVIIPNE